MPRTLELKCWKLNYSGMLHCDNGCKLNAMSSISMPCWISLLMVMSHAVQVEDAADVKKMAQDLNAQVTRLQSTLQRINAPNMKALEKWVWHTHKEGNWQLQLLYSLIPRPPVQLLLPVLQCLRDKSDVSGACVQVRGCWGPSAGDGWSIWTDSTAGQKDESRVWDGQETEVCVYPLLPCVRQESVYTCRITYRWHIHVFETQLKYIHRRLLTSFPDSPTGLRHFVWFCPPRNL